MAPGGASQESMVTAGRGPSASGRAATSSVGVVGALILVQVMFGLHYLAAKVVLAEIPPRAWAFLRVSTAALCLLALTRASGRRFPTTFADLRSLALYSVFGVVINQICFVEGLSRTTPTHSSLMNTTIPVLTLVIAVMLGQERLRPRSLVALLVALVGVVTILRPEPGELARLRLAGDVLTLVNATSFSLFLVLSKRMITRSDALGATAVLMSLGSLGVAVVGIPELIGFPLGNVSSRTWWLAAFIVVFPTAGGYLLNYWALARVDSSKVAFFILLQPLIAGLLSMALLGERPGWNVAAGGVLIFAGVYLTIVAERPVPRPAGRG